MNAENSEKKICGIVMPISAIDGCSEEHWRDVILILKEAISSADFEPNLVSNADDVGVIQKRIIQNLYDNPIVVCDVSGKNPNVMFELGMRLAFDKPTIIIKDDKTSYSFDTSPIEHLEYPRDLRFSKIVDFKENLKEKIIKTYKASMSDRGYTTFLKHFGEFKVAKLDKKEVSGLEYIIDEMKGLKTSISRLERVRSPSSISRYNNSSSSSDDVIEIEIDGKGDLKEELVNILNIPGVNSIKSGFRGDKQVLNISINDLCDPMEVNKYIQKLKMENSYNRKKPTSIRDRNKDLEI